MGSLPTESGEGVQVVGQPPTIAAKEEMTRADLKKGDVVELKSGGPHMTIDEIKSGGRVYYLWFKGNERDSGLFDSETLKPSPEGGHGRAVSRG